MDKEKIHPPPPPPPPTLQRLHNQNSQNMNNKMILPPSLSLLPPPPPPPRLLPPPPLLPPTSPSPTVQRSHNLSNNNKELMDMEKLHPPPPPAPLYILHRRMKRFHNQTCPLSLLSYHQPHILIGKSGGNTESPCFSCGAQKPLITDSTFSYHCTTCDVDFHYGCHEFPRRVTHPYHLQHPLTFTSLETGIISDGNIDESFRNAVLCDSRRISDPKMPETIDVVVDNCSWCGNNIQGRWFYRCSLCNFSLDFSCYRNVPLLIIPNPKSHYHSLFFYPRPLLTPCNACGFVNALEPSYACFQCNYMVHQSCIDLPRVIKITRHRHRLSHTLYLQPITSPCRICYKTVDGKYGQYSCGDHEDCSYVAHSKCATHKNIWDGKELEWEPEESDELDYMNAPFKRLGHGTIKHFSHRHPLKLEKYDGVRDAEKQCQACILPIDSCDFYNCMQCDFFLHEVCAGLLRKLDHALHVHTLVLDPSSEYFPPLHSCSVCARNFSGFRYKCPKKDCVINPNGFQIDVRCVLVPDYFKHKCHEHPMFISTFAYDGSKNKIYCKGCKEVCMKSSYIQCTICEFALCYQCATIPYEVSYKYDKHPLSLCYGEIADGLYWCEVCEKEINPTSWFYTCNECCVTIHLRCVFGSSVYMKPGFMFGYYSPKYMYSSSKVKVFRNSNSTRPLCDSCGHHCPSSVYYKSHCSKKVSCSFNCLEIQTRE